MKLSRLTHHLAFGTLILLGFAGSTVTAAPSTTTTNKPSTTSSASSSTTTAKQPTAGSGVQGYASDSPLQNGTIVQLSGSNASTVAAANQAKLEQMYGVTVDPHLLSLTISDASLKNEVFVSTSGTYSVLVSSQGGTIQAGDYVTLSSIDGVAMKASTDEKTVFGRAAGGFDGKANTIGSSTLKDSAGNAKVVTFGIIPVAINIERNPNEKSTKANLPKVLQRIGQAVAEKPVGPLRIYLSIIITGLSIIVAIVTLYAGVRNSIISIGRNPLSKKSVFRGLLEIILTSFLILIIGLFAVYLLLKL
jgi:hypothetical protein